MSKEILYKSSQAFVLRIVGMGMGYFFTLLVTRYYGAGTWGLFALALMIVELTSMVGRHGMDTVSLKIGAELIATYKSSQLLDFFRKILFSALTLSFVLAVVIYGFSDVIAGRICKTPDLAPYLRILAFVIPFKAVLILANQLIRAHKQIAWYAFIGDVSVFLLSAMILSIVLVLGGHINISYVYFLGILFTTVLTIIVLFRLTKGFQKQVCLDDSMSYWYLLKLGIPLLFASSLFFVMKWTDTFMLGVLRSEAEVGIYNVVFRLSALTIIFRMAINSIIGVKFSQYWSSNKELELKRLAQLTSNALFFITIPIGIAVIVYADFLLNFFGADFMIGEAALVILIIGNMFSASCGLLGMFLQMSNKQHLFQNIIIVAALINIVLNYLLIPKYGMMGAAYASVVSTIFWNLFCLLYMYIKNKYWLGINPFLFKQQISMALEIIKK